MANKFVLLILIIFAGIIFLHFYNQRNKETFKTTKKLKNWDDNVYRDPGTSGITTMGKDKPWWHVVSKLEGKQKKLTIYDNYTGYQNNEEEKEEEQNNIKIERKEDNLFTDVDGNVMSAKQSAKEMKEYIKNIVLNGQTDCYCVDDKNPFDDKNKQDEIEEFRETQLDFKTKINGSSSPFMDDVDKINILYLRENDKGLEGKTIAEIHDKIIGNASTLNIVMNNNIAGNEYDGSEYVKKIDI